MDFHPKFTIGAFSLVVLVIFTRSSAYGGNILYEGNATVDEGEPFTISCFLTLFDPVQWEKDGKVIVSEPGPTSAYTFHEESVDGKVMASLVVKKASPQHSGSYRCNTLSTESHQIYVISASELTPNRDYDGYKVLNYAEPLVLTCNESNPSPDFVMKWLKNGKPIHTSEGERPNIVIKNTSLTINRAMDDDVANYTCQLVNVKANNSVVASADFWVVGKPFVKIQETVTVIEEEKLKLECIVLGKPAPTVEWRVGNRTYDQSDGRVKLSTDPNKGIKNNILELEPVQMSDRGEIVCSGHNVATTIFDPNEAKVFVRVKDKYAALWPFLGICAEVIVLCAVIFIYEKKRNKAELEESDTDQSPEQKNTPDHGKDSVRHRK
ncbi:basigin isoform X2 [Homalodisca vitripennis]|uniref:basigin isoform X2 n=1 Tax=Homalodisca vitripennis TaxID=197043 RepID=UPI001EEA5916|nr:basigin isoform X2 [Homalodisca vitripennis]